MNSSTVSQQTPEVVAPKEPSPAKLIDARLAESFSPESLRWSNVDWPVLVFIATMHIGALAAPFFFTWEALGVAVVLYWLTASMGITMGYHRYLAHRSFKLTRVGQFIVYLCGCLAVQGTPLRWAATHRLHHRKSDKPGDPHSPREGNWWSHILWLFVHRRKEDDRMLYRRYVPDLLQDPMLRFFEVTFIWWTALLAVGLYLWGGLPMVLWGVCLRMVLVHHNTWFVNSATHLWGYRTYETSDDSRNLWWVALATFGEGWHNNHHAHPSLARAGLRWWEFDATFWLIRTFQLLGLAYDVRDAIPATGEKRKAV